MARRAGLAALVDSPRPAQKRREARIAGLTQRRLSKRDPIVSSRRHLALGHF
jgi:hypothetical protein